MAPSSVVSRARVLAQALFAASLVAACRCGGGVTEDRSDAADAATADQLPEPDTAAVEVLFLPDSSLQSDAALALPPAAAQPFGRCPRDMVDIAGAFCIDRYEATLVDVSQGRRLSPYYHPTRAQTEAAYEKWQGERAKTSGGLGRAISVPAPDPWQLDERFEPRAVALADVIPNGYLSGKIAETACRNAGKRLCQAEEWRRACRGESGSKFPYGDSYRSGACNVARASHPAALLHGNASIHHRDPRLNTVEDDEGPLLRRTGSTAECLSRWGADAAYDMVGNLDEWVDDAGGRFLGGFFARSTREGCDAEVSAHPPQYYDYSLGVRCCL